MTPGSLLLGGMPPVGLGVYCRRDVLGEPFRFRVVNGFTHRSQIARALDLGPTWLFGGPSYWTPRAWRLNLPGLVALAEATGCAGIIVDAENEWPQSNREETAALGDALAEMSKRVRVGFTSYPAFPRLEVLASHAGANVWGSPQIYGRDALDAASFDAWFARWRALFGMRCIPSISGSDDTSPRLDTGAAYLAYLDMLPRASGAIVWPDVGGIPRHMQGGLSGYSPGGSLPGTALLAIAAFAARPQALAIAALILAILAIRVYLYAR